MSKQHHISFVAAVASDEVQIIKLYPESVAEVRFPIRGIKKIYFYCNKDGMFCHEIIPSIDGKEFSYDDIKERIELENMAKMLFG